MEYTIFSNISNFTKGIAMIDKAEIIKLKKQNKSQREIAEILDCSSGYVSRIIKEFGHSNNIDDKYIGSTFGILTPIKRIGSDKYSHALYLCVCSCGNTAEVLGHSLLSGNTRSCGCSSRKIGKNHGLWSGYEGISTVYYNRVMNGAKKRNIKFDLTIQDMWNKFVEQNKRCSLSGIKLMFSPTNKTRNLQTASLDRIDSKIGYYYDNIQWIHKNLNIMKWHISNKDFINWCHEVSKYQRTVNNEL